MKNVRQLVLLGILISFVITTVTYNSNYTFARNKDARFEVVDCPIEGDSTFQKSVPCPGPGGVSSSGNSKLESQPPSAVIASNPFASIS